MCQRIMKCSHVSVFSSTHSSFYSTYSPAVIHHLQLAKLFKCNLQLYINSSLTLPPPPIANHNPMSKLLGVLSCQLFLVSPPLLKYETLFQLRGLLQVESVDAGVVHQEKISGITVGQLWDSPVYITYVRYCYYNIATQNLQN